MLKTRSAAECRLYMDLHPCFCGESEFDAVHHLAGGAPDGPLTAVYEGRCRRCGLPRRFAFALSEELSLPPPHFGAGPRPSEIIDPAQFLDFAVASAASPGYPLRQAVAGVDEVLKFIPEGAEAVPVEAFTSMPGKAAYAADPDRFSRQRLEAVRRAYTEGME